MNQKLSETLNKREKAAAQKREKILNAAMIRFLENGYHQTGMRDIAKHAGVSLGNLYNHFPGKHDMLVEIAALERSELQPFLKMLEGSAPAPETLEAFITAYAKYLAIPESVMLTIELGSEAIRKPDIGNLFLANREDLVSALAGVIQRGLAAGDFRKDLDSHDASHLIIELIEASAYRSVLSDIAMPKILGGLKDFVFSAIKAT